MSTIMNKNSNATEEPSQTAESSHQPTQLEDSSSNDEQVPKLSIKDIDLYDPEIPHCICRQPFVPDDEEGGMVECDNPRCLVGWYHGKCLGLKKLPGEKEEWVCRGCKHPKFRMPTPNWERIEWYGEKVSAEGHSMDKRLEAERSRVLGLREETVLERISAAEWLHRWKKAREADKKKQAEEEKAAKKQKAIKELEDAKASRKDSPMEGEDQTDAERVQNAETVAPVQRPVQKESMAKKIDKKKPATKSAAGGKRKARNSAQDEDSDRPNKRGGGKSFIW